MTRFRRHSTGMIWLRVVDHESSDLGRIASFHLLREISIEHPGEEPLVHLSLLDLVSPEEDRESLIRSAFDIDLEDALS